MKNLLTKIVVEEKLQELRNSLAVLEKTLSGYEAELQHMRERRDEKIKMIVALQSDLDAAGGPVIEEEKPE